MSEEEPTSPTPHPAPTAPQETNAIDQLFGSAEAEDGDVFASLASGEAVEVDVGDDEAKHEDLFDQIGRDQSETQDAVEPPAVEDEKPVANPTQSADPDPESAPEAVDPQPSTPPVQAAPPVEQVSAPAQDPAADEEKDFSDLLAEFEAEHEVPPEEPIPALEAPGAAVESSEPADRDIAEKTPDQRESGAIEAADENVAEHHTVPEADSGTLQVPVAAAALFVDDTTDSSTFDALIPPSEPDHPATSTPPGPSSPSPVPDLSIEDSKAQARPTGLGIDAAGDTSFQSMFSDTSNWLGDTTPDDSVQLRSDNQDHQDNSQALDNKPANKQDEGDEPLQFEVPQGWYDDNGEWNWYTDEEREQVRSTMLGQSDWAEAAPDTPSKLGLGQDADEPPAIPYSPALQAGLSENSARRTPQPDTPSKLPSHSYDPYAPSATTTATTPYSGPSSSTYSSSNSPYAPYSSPSVTNSYAPSSSFDPYASAAPAAPVSNPYAPAARQQTDPYAPQSSSNSYTAPTQRTADPYAPAPVHEVYSAASYASKPTETKPQPPKPKPQPQRVASNAYDPPFLRPQKSFVRPPAAVPSPGYPAFGVSPSLAMSPPQPAATPPPPPSGPPKRPKTEGRPPSRGPAFAAPPPKPLPRAQSQHDHSAGYDAPHRPPSISQDRQAVDLAQSFSPPQPLHRPPPSAFDPPLRAKSYAAPPRPHSGASHRGYGSPPQAPAPPAFAPPPKASESPYAPPRPLSRGPPSRHASPAFEARPPSRPDITQRMRSPAQNTFSPGVEQLLSPPTAGTHLPDHRTASFGRRRSSGVYSGEEDHDGYQPNENERSRRSQELEETHVSPPVLSRTYDEEGEGDLTENEDPYAPTSQASAPQAYQPPSRHQEPRYADEPAFHPPPRAFTASPAAHKPTYDAYAPAPSSLGLKTHASPEKKTHPSTSPYAAYSPHAPSSGGVVDLSEDPYAPTSTHNEGYSHDPYAPTEVGSSQQQRQFQPTHPSQSSTGAHEPSPHSPQAVPKPIGISQPPNPYAPAPAPARTASPAYSTGYGLSPPTNNYFQSMHSDAPSDSTYVPQQVLEQKPVSEDPLGRCTLAARNAPIAVFGFGGVLITAFPGAAESGDFHKGHSRIPSYGYASGRGQLWIRSVSEVAAPSALKSDQTSFPGPLVFDPSTPKGAAGDKKKREAVLAYLESRAEEIEKGLPYLKSSANKARREEEGRLVVIRALRALIIGEGKLTGSPQVEEALREALANPSPTAISTSPVASIPSNSFSSSLYPPAQASSTATPVAASASQLTHISDLLSQGNKRDAALWAAEQGLWSHALVISSSVDVELWREIVGRFTASEIGEKPQGTAGIKASYILFSGINASNIDELVNAATITDDPSNDQWREVVGTVLFNAKPSELACLEELGTKFLNTGLVNAAYACFLLSPLSPFFDLTAASYERQIMLTNNHRDEEAIVFAEIAEYARSLVPTPKGQEPIFAGMPQLLPYKLARAWRLAELGEVDLAQKYCSAIEAGSKIGKNVPSLLPPAFAASVEDLLERLTGTPSAEPAKGMGSGRKGGNKPGFDKLGSWIEGRLTKFIAGEEGDGAPPSKPLTTGGKAAGPFAQFSTISPNAGGALSRQGSVADLGGVAPNGYLGVQPVSRTTSPSLHMKASGGWGQPPSQGYGHASSSSSSSYGDQHARHPGAASYSPWLGNDASEETVRTDDTPQGYEQDQSGPTGDHGEFISPMAQLNLGPNPSTSTTSYEPSKSSGPAFEEDDEDDLGFGNKALSRNRTPKPAAEGEETNGAKSGSKPAGKETKAEPTKAAPVPPAKPEHKASWLGRIWGGKKDGGESHGPTKANLGEESSMVFDPELKRWVVRGAKVEAAAPSAPPPPPRAQTASPSIASRPEPSSAAAQGRASSAAPPFGHRPPPPSMSMSNLDGTPHGNTFPRGGPPLAGVGFAEGPDGGIKRIKSSLNESVTASDITPPGMSPPTPGSGGRLPPPPGGGPPSRPGTATTASLDDLLSRPPSRRPGSAAAKKGARNRYVDVFQPGAEGS